MSLNQMEVEIDDQNRLAELLANGADPNKRDRARRSPLMYAAQEGHLASMQLLISYKADPNLQDQTGLSALHFAAQDFRPEAVEFLCSLGAAIDLQDDFGNTPLWKAVFSSKGRGDIIGLLLRYGADRTIKNKAGKTPVEAATMIANYDIKQYFK